jgi:hypothetical protein
MSRISRTAAITALLALAVQTVPAPAADWKEVQGIKKQLLSTAAQHAMEQQKRTAGEPVAIPFPDSATNHGGVAFAAKSPKSMSIKGNVTPNRWNGGQPDFIRMELPQAVDMFSAHSGLAMTVNTKEGTSPEVRIGARLIAEDGSMVEILPAVVLKSAWGANPHEIYLDWAFGNYAGGEGPAEKAAATLKKVKTIELTFGGMVRAPERGASKGNQPAECEISDFRLVDYLKGSYDPSRHKLKIGKDLTLQHRVQEVTGIVITYGGEEGIKSGIESLDLCARTQCWDGSFLDGRRGAVTVASGEYTFGFTIYGTVEGYMALRAMKHPALQEKITIGPDTMTRDQFYQRMYYRAAMSRAIVIPSKYRDDIIGGDTLMTGANRVLGYAVAMRMAANVLDDPKQKAEVIEKYQPIMQEIADAQGRYSGGFPVLGEGDIYQGKGIHYDAGYTRTHMDVLVVGVHHTNDPLLIQMLKRYQTVFDAAMDNTGMGLVGLLSERHPTDGIAELIIPDLTAQVGMKYNLPIIAQWGYNDGVPVWKKYEPGKALNHFTYIARITGYPLGAHSQFLMADTQAQPEPKDLGYLFPRQYPIWSSRFVKKDDPQKVVRTSKVYVHPDGRIVNDFHVEIGEFPQTVGVPVSIKSTDGVVTCEAVEGSGWAKLVPAGAEFTLGYITGGKEKGLGVIDKGKVGVPLSLTLTEATEFTLSLGEVTLPSEAGGKKVGVNGKFILTPEKKGQKVELLVHNGTIETKQKTIPPAVLQGLPGGTNVALRQHGTKVTNVKPRAAVDMGRVIDGDMKNFGALDSLAKASFSIELVQPFELDKIVITPGQYRKIEERTFPRPKDVVVRIAGKEPLAITLEDKPFEEQSFDLKGVKTDRIDIEVKSTYPAADEKIDYGGFAEIEIIKK